MKFEVLRIGYYHHGQSNLGGSSGLTSQITLCRYNGTLFAVRENVNAIPSFNISSCERWGDKTGKKPSASRQSLELLAPANQWDEIAALVKEADGLKRPVLKNIRFTWNWIYKKFKTVTS